MSTTTLSITRRRVGLWARTADYVELTKPKISTLVLVSVGVSAYVARWGRVEAAVLSSTLLGTLLVAASGSALNQWVERRRDARMRRTQNRPLAAGRLSSAEVVWFSAVTMLTGTILLGLAVNWLAAALGILTWLTYVAVYTPLKTRTPLNTAIGAIAGALPVLIGWSSTQAGLDLRIGSLFTILLLWQFPHFMAIAWMYRDQYARAGMKMLPVVDPSGRRAGLQAVLAALALLPVSILPGLLAPSASFYVVVVFLLGVGQLVCALRFFLRLDDASARLLLRASLIYLPALLGLLMLIPMI